MLFRSITDDADRENEGDLICAAQCATAEAVNFMAKHARGLICVPLAEERAQQFGLNAMVQNSGDTFRTNFTVSVDAAHGITTGISAPDRARTVGVLASPASKASLSGIWPPNPKPPLSPPPKIAFVSIIFGPTYLKPTGV